MGGVSLVVDFYHGGYAMNGATRPSVFLIYFLFTGENKESSGS